MARGAAPSPCVSLPGARLALPGTQTRFSQEPADQTVVAGQRAVLPCVLLNYSGIVQWTKDGLALGMGQGLKGEWAPAGPASTRPSPCSRCVPASLHPAPHPKRCTCSWLPPGAKRAAGSLRPRGKPRDL